MALQIKKPGIRTDYVLAADRESSQPTRFVLRALTWDEMMEIGELTTITLEQALQIHAITSAARDEQREMTPEENERVNAVAPMDGRAARRLTQQHALAVRYGVAEIRGLLDTDGAALKMSGAELASAAPGDVIIELGTEIMRISRHGDDVIKK